MRLAEFDLKTYLANRGMAVAKDIAMPHKYSQYLPQKVSGSTEESGGLSALPPASRNPTAALNLGTQEDQPDNERNEQSGTAKKNENPQAAFKDSTSSRNDENMNRWLIASFPSSHSYRVQNTDARASMSDRELVTVVKSQYESMRSRWSLFKTLRAAHTIRFINVSVTLSYFMGL